MKTNHLSISGELLTQGFDVQYLQEGKGYKKCDVLSMYTSQKSKKLLAEDLNLEPSG